MVALLENKSPVLNDPEIKIKQLNFQKNEEKTTVNPQENSIKSDTTDVSSIKSGHALAFAGIFDRDEKITKEPDNSLSIEYPRNDLNALIQEFFPGSKIISQDSSSSRNPNIAGNSHHNENILFEAKNGKKYYLNHNSSYGCFGPLGDKATIRQVTEEKAKEIIERNKLKIYDKKIPLADPKILFPTKTIENEYSVSKNTDGSISVNFDRGNSPEYRKLIVDLFPNAKNINFGEVSYQRPFVKMDFEVDGKKYNLSELTGGIIASSGLTISPVK